MSKEDKFVEDPRFQTCFREMLYSYGFYLLFFIVVMASTYGLGKHLVMGMPLWFLMAAIVIPIIFIGVLYFMSEKVFEDTALDAYLEEEEKGVK